MSALWRKDVKRFLDAIGDPARRNDSRVLVEIMSEVTSEPPRLWGANIIGFGKYQYRYTSGREGEYCKIGFSPRADNLTIYLLSGLVGYDDLLSQLGKYKSGKSTVKVTRLDDVDREVLTRLLTRAVRHIDQVVADMGGLPRMSEMPPYRDDWVGLSLGASVWV